MSVVKNQAIDLIKSLPEDCTLEDIQHHLYVCEKVRRGIQAVDDGRVVSQDEAERRVREWLRSSGQNQP
jgi:hypothetical protein